MSHNDNVHFDGNVTADNIHLPAYMRTSSNSTIAVGSAGVWENITFSKSAESLKVNIEHTYNDATNETITINDAGTYWVSYTISFIDTAPNPAAHIGAQLWSTTTDSRVKGSYAEIDSTKQNTEMFLHNSFLCEFTAGETIKTQFTASETTVSIIPHGTYNPKPASAQISIARDGGG